MEELRIEFIKSSSKEDIIHINQKKAVITGMFSILKYVDKETQQVVIYLPALEISGYGETDEKATEILRFNIHELFKYLIDLPPVELKSYLQSAGWSNKLFNKDFSKAFVDTNGDLKNFAVDEKVERLTLQMV